MRRYQGLLKRASGWSSVYGLATVVQTTGSAYRRPGARLFVSPEGAPVGAVSGGCLEAEIARRAADAVASGQARVLAFDAGDRTGLGFGSGCGSLVQVLVQPVDPADPWSAPALLARLAAARRPGALATIIAAPPGLAALLGQNVCVLAGEAHGPRLPYDLGEALAAEAGAALSAGAGRIAALPTPEGPVEALVDPVLPAPRLVAFGESHDAPPLLQAAALLGWETVQIGARPPGAHAAADYRFAMHPDEAAARAAVDAWTACVVMSHHYPRDRALLGALLGSDAFYLGVLGPRARTEAMLQELGPAAAPGLARVYAPVGLDLGAETPEEIALAILAEALRVWTRRSGASLRDAPGAIHDSPLTPSPVS